MFIGFALLLTLACSSNLNDTVSLNKTFEFNQYNANEFVINVTDILIQDGKPIFVDEGLSKIIIMDENFKSPVFIGERGYGPNELLSPKLLLSNDKILFVYDAERKRILNVDVSKGLVSNEMSLGISMSRDNAMINQSTLYFTSTVESGIQRFDLIKGTSLDIVNLPDTSADSPFGRYIFSHGEEFITVVGYDIPVIEKYNKEWALTDSYSLEEIPIIKPFLSYQPPQNFKISGAGSVKIKASAKITVSCARLHNQTLYLLVYTLGSDSKTRRNTILKFKDDGKSWQYSGNLLLPEMGDYSTFALHMQNNQLIAFESISRTLEVFKIEN